MMIGMRGADNENCSDGGPCRVYHFRLCVLESEKKEIAEMGGIERCRPSQWR